MLQALLFLHVLAVALLFTGLGMEIAALLAASRATTAAQVRVAMTYGRFMGPLMGGSAGLLILAGIAMVLLAGYGWQPWIVTGLVVAVVLSVMGPTINGRRNDAIETLAEQGGDGPITPALDAALTDRVLRYVVAFMITELLAVIYVMTNKPAVLGCILAVVVAALLALIPAARASTSSANAVRS
jgi:Predicted integral membrane protein (DUF2269)